jgi:cation diffusion facilitator family transporter
MERTEKTAILSGAACAVFAIFLLAMAVSWHSIAAFVGGILTVSRAVTGFLVAAGIRLSRKHTENFNLGLYKLENLVVTVIGILVLFGAYELGKIALFRLHAGVPLMTGSEKGIPVLISAALIAAVIALFKNRIGKKDNCPSLRADGRHSFIDAVAMLIIAVGVGLSAAGLRGADSVAALLVALVVFWGGGQITIDGIRVLLDASVERSVLDKVEKIVRDDPRIRDVLEIGGRNSGSHRFLTLKLVPARYDLQAAAAITKDLRERIMGEIKNADEVCIEYGLSPVDRQNVAVPLDGEGFYAGSAFTGAPRFAILDVDTAGWSVLRKRIIENPFAGTGPKDAINLAVMLARLGVDAVVVAEPLKDKDVQHTFDAYGTGLLFAPQGSGQSDMGAVLRDAAKKPGDAERGAS